MFLLRKLFRGQFVELNHLPRELVCVLETFCEQHDLSNHRVVRDHHRNWSKKRFQVVWQFSPACITWIHGDENAKILLDGQYLPLQLYLSFVLLQTHSD
jgi:hypothetical protein